LNTISPKIAYFLLGMVSTALRYFIAKIWFLLFFTVSASKFAKLLIMYKIMSPLSTWRGVGGEVTNRIQRENLFNDAIASQEYFSYSSHPLQKTNFLKPRRAVTSRRRYEACCHFTPPTVLLIFEPYAANPTRQNRKHPSPRLLRHFLSGIWDCPLHRNSRKFRA
jgi:hypothetical protein